MAKTESPYRCDECGLTTLKWVGRCGECQSWGTVVEVGAPTSASRQAVAVVPSADRIAKPITEHTGSESGHVPTGVS